MKKLLVLSFLVLHVSGVYFRDGNQFQTPPRRQVSSAPISTDLHIISKSLENYFEKSRLFQS